MDRHGADRWLLSIMIGTVVLVVIALAIALTRGEKTYIEETSPDGVAHNYLFALEQESYERAYGYLSPELANYPANLDDFQHDMSSSSTRFSKRNDLATTVRETNYFGENRALVYVEVTRFRTGVLFGSNQSTTDFNLTLVQIGDDWKIIEGSSGTFWHSCWSSITQSCPHDDSGDHR